MHKWLAFPWVRYACWLIIGIMLAHVLPQWEAIALWCSVIFAMMFLVGLWFAKQNNPGQQLLCGILGFGLLLSFGYWRSAHELNPPVLTEPTAAYWYMQVAQTPVETAARYRFEATIWSEHTAGKKIKVMAYVAKDQLQPQIGQLLFARARLQEVPVPLNPHEFDYRSYLASQKIQHQLFVQAFMPLQEQTSLFSFWKRTAVSSRDYLLEVVSRFILHKEAAAVVKAMVLGQRSELDRSLRQAYADAGVMHVLAVSGLHVGMVYFLMNLLFAPLRHSRRKRLLWLVLTLLVLWCYAWLTGLAPSAQRASVMFSLIAVGKAIQRRGNIYNSIGISAFILLVADPLLIKQVGFQLSYLAVMGIVYLQPRISRWYQPGQVWKKKLWELISVTLAAQLATFPLGLYYFHQFPTYFFVGNLLAVPLAFLILYNTLLLMVLHWIPVLGITIGWLIDMLVLGLNSWVRLTEHLPFSKLTAVISPPETILIYCCLLAILIFVRLRSYGLGMFGLFLMLMLAVSGMYRTYNIRSQQYITIYQIPGHSLLHFIHGQQEVILPLGEAPSQQQLAYHLEPARIQAGLPPLLENQKLPQDFSLQQTEYAGIRILLWQGLRIAIVEGTAFRKEEENQIHVDVLLLRNNPGASLELLGNVFRAKVVVVDASNSQHYRQQVKSESNSLLLPLHITSEAGAYQIQL